MIHNYGNGLLTYFIREQSDGITFDFVKKLFYNFVPIGIIFYTMVKYVQYMMYNDHNGSLSKDTIYNIVSETIMEESMDINTDA